MKSRKLDRRHNGYDIFQYGVDFTNNEELKFCQIREWCWQQFGPSCELDIARKIKYSNSLSLQLGLRDFDFEPSNKVQWAWLRDPTRTRIYFHSTKEYHWFLLNWGNK